MNEHRKNVRNLLAAVVAAKRRRDLFDVIDSAQEDCAVLWTVARSRSVKFRSEEMHKALGRARATLPLDFLAAKVSVVASIRKVPMS